MNRICSGTIIKKFIIIVFLSIITACSQPHATKALPSITPMAGTGKLVQPQNPDKFNFVIFGDSQGQEDHPTLRAIFKDMDSVSNPGPSFAISLGDIIRGEPIYPFKSGPIEEHLQYALKIAKLAGVPVFNAPGNHEMDDVVSTNPWTEMPSKQMHDAYEKVIGPASGSFDFGSSHFIVINTEDVPPPGMKPPEPPMEFSYIGKAQLAGIKTDLDANRNKTHIFIVMHYPIHAFDPSRDNLYGESLQALLNMFKNYKNISFVVASHEHQYFNPRDPNNVTTIQQFTAGDSTRYLVSGGAGAPFYNGQPGLWAFHHYLLFEVNGSNVNVTIHRVQ
jgi:Calcineurin-like phosphoesterase